MEYTVECIRCGNCVRECHQLARAVTLTETGAKLDLDKCISCGHCMAVCPTDAMVQPKAPQGPLAGEYPKAADMARFLRQPRSVRVFKEGALVPRDTMAELLDIGRYAQTAVNSQGISYLVLEGRDKMVELGNLYCQTVIDRDICDPLRPTLPDIAREQLDTGRDIIFRDAPELVVALADESHPRARDNARFSLTFIALLAPSMGVGTCWGGYFEALAMDERYAPVFHEFLGIPKGKTIGGGMMMGIPDITYRRLPERNPTEVSWR